MNKQQHIILGTAAFFVYFLLISFLMSIPIEIMAFGFIAALSGSLAPDIFEPPTSWMHRGLGHSKRALIFNVKIFAITAVLGLISIIFQVFFISFVISSFFLGYVVHLLADATTDVGLPD